MKMKIKSKISQKNFENKFLKHIFAGRIRDKINKYSLRIQ
ncbi:hypothetical protein HMPREF0971_00302 [Segatella oris F0302]|uniref:Uncharacterized protein n=1 Tax=Segatella oris F0302 TaxID=649760 RepID=D1QML8_9BACT|nr:hypothetical protein HMPREF0971_00302 [Segatella oris F0302]